MFFEAATVEDVTACLEAGADVNARNRDYPGSTPLTPLHRAIEKNELQIAEVLLKSGADVNARLDGGDTPLHRAAWRGAPAVFETLLNGGADVNARDDYGSTPLHELAEWSISSGEKSVVLTQNLD